MEEIFSEKTGRKFINLSRETLISEFIDMPVEIPNIIDFRKSRALFVTLKSKKTRYAGSTIATYSIGDAIIKLTKKAAFENIKEKPIKEEEVNDIKIEISILNEIKKAKNDILNDFELGVDGLICKFFGYTGALLPQIAHEKNLNKTEFLEELCKSAGIPKDNWKKPAISFYKFQTQIFREPKK